MKVTREEMKIEALKRIKELEKVFDLNPNIYEYFFNDKLYYSYLICGTLGSIDTIKYNQNYEKLVNEFENKTNYLVYHVLEYGKSIAFLYVSNDDETWNYERLYANKYLYAYVCYLDDEDSCEYGDIIVTSSSGALIRLY